MQVIDVPNGPVEQSGWARAANLLIQLSIFIPAVVAVSDDQLSGQRRLAVAALAAALLGWYALMAFRWHYWNLPALSFAATLFVAGALWTPLLLIHSAFGYSIGAYAVAACPFLRRAVLSIGALTVLLLAVDWAASGELTFHEATRIVLTSAAVLVIHGVVSRIHYQNEQRRLLIEELRSTQDELARRERQAGKVTERQRLARDIHDSFAQGFTSIIMLLEAADARLDSEAVDVRARIDQARQAARDNLAEARRVVWSLRPTPLDTGALAGALEVLANTTATTVGVDVEFSVNGNPCPLAPDQEVAIYRAMQEALANVVKHAEATTVICTLTFLDDEAILDINDDGQGFDPTTTTPTPSGGLGLLGLAERITAAGGALHIDSAPGAETTLTVTMPVRTDDLAHHGPDPERSP